MSQRPNPSGRRRLEAPRPATPDPDDGTASNQGSQTQGPTNDVKRRIVRRVVTKVTARSDDGVLMFTLIPFEGGVLHVERVQHVGTRSVAVSMEFRDGDSFVRWCASDHLRLAYPLLYANLRRRARGLFNPLA